MPIFFNVFFTNKILRATPYFLGQYFEFCSVDWVTERAFGL